MGLIFVLSAIDNKMNSLFMGRNGKLDGEVYSRSHKAIYFRFKLCILFCYAFIEVGDQLYAKYDMLRYTYRNVIWLELQFDSFQQ